MLSWDIFASHTDSEENVWQTNVTPVALQVQFSGTWCNIVADWTELKTCQTCLLGKSLVLRGFLSHICSLGKWRWNDKKIGGICFVIRHFVPDIWYRIRLEKHLHVFCKASVLGLCLMACSWLPTNKTKQSGSLLCNVYYIGGSGLRFKQKWATANRKCLKVRKTVLQQKTAPKHQPKKPQTSSSQEESSEIQWLGNTLSQALKYSMAVSTETEFKGNVQALHVGKNFKTWLLKFFQYTNLLHIKPSDHWAYLLT